MEGASGDLLPRGWPFKKPEGGTVAQAVVQRAVGIIFPEERNASTSDNIPEWAEEWVHKSVALLDSARYTAKNDTGSRGEKASLALARQHREFLKMRIHMLKKMDNVQSSSSTSDPKAPPI